MEFLIDIFESAMWVAVLLVLCQAKESRRKTAVGSVITVILLFLNVTLMDHYWGYSNYTFLIDLVITITYAMIFLGGMWYWKVFSILVYDIALFGCSFLAINVFVNILRIPAEEIIRLEGTYRVPFVLCSKGMLLALLLTAYYNRDKIKKLEKMGVGIVLLPILTCAIGLTLMEMFSRFYTALNIVWIIWLLVLIFVSFFVCFRFAYDAYRGREERKLTDLLQKQIAIQQELYEQQYRNIRRVRKHQHDIKHKLVVIQQMLMQKDYEKAKSYTEEYLAELENIKELKYGDSVISTMLLLKEERAQKLNVQMSVDIQVFHTKRISEIDLSVILGNLLDNALEAEKEVENAPLIKVCICEKQLLYVSVENRIEEPVEEQHLQGRSSKRDSALHGFGISCIRELVEKYNGTMEIQNQNGWFRVELYI